MAKKNEEWIHVPEYVEGGRRIIPEVWISGKPELLLTEDPQPYSALEAQELNPPTLAILTHAFFDDVSPEYHSNVRSSPVSGEWTSTFVVDGNTSLERPEKIIYIPKFGIWLAEGGKRTKIELPPRGFALEYDKLTGFPSRTGSESEAEKIFDSDRSFFSGVANGQLNPVLREYLIESLGPFYIKILNSPSIKHEHWGARRCRYARGE